MHSPWPFLLSIVLGGACVCPAAYAAFDWPDVQPAEASLILVLVLALILLVPVLFVRPVRLLRRRQRERKAYENARMERVVVVGLDGMDPELSARWMRQGKLPHLARMAKTGTFRPLATTHPPVSLVAWSTFLTGVNPGKHNVFDVVRRDRHTYRPGPSSARVFENSLRLFPGMRARHPEVKALRKSKPFWHHLGDSGIFSSIIRVPATFPPEPHNGLLLSGLGVPDLRGTPGTYSYFTSRETSGGRQEGGEILQLVQEGEAWLGNLPGPENPRSKGELPDLSLRFTLSMDGIRPQGAGRRAVIELDGRRVELRVGKFSGWIPVRFQAGGGVHREGICRVFLKSLRPEVELYVTPVQIDPNQPALPISHPAEYSGRLGKMHGEFATLGSAEDVWAFSNGVLEATAFLDQCYQVQEERERMFFDALSETKRGLCMCVFDIMDRIQHMFWRSVEPSPNEPPQVGEVELLYQRIDALVGRVLECAGKDTLVLVLSDHGFRAVSRLFNLNAWLHQHGYLALVSGSTVSEERFRQVDWQRTRAYALGNHGLYLNLIGRERYGIVQPGLEADALLIELRDRLRAIRDRRNSQAPIREVFDSREIYSGPYAENAPDLVLSYASGFGPARESVIGAVRGEIFQENSGGRSGGHAMDPRDVSGVLFANRTILGDRPALADVAPTILQLFGVPIPPYMDGHPWTVRTQTAPPRPSGPVAGPL